MTRTHLPVVAHALLSFVESERPDLAGDLVEELHDGRSRRWFWTQLLGAALMVAWRKRAAPEPIHILPPGGRPPVREIPLLDPALINLTGTNVRGVGGLSLLALIMLMTLVMPQTWWLVAIGLAGGSIVGVVLIRRRRQDGLDTRPPGRGPLGLVEPPPMAEAARPPSPHGTRVASLSAA